MNILLAADNKYLKYMENLIFSIKSNLDDENIKIYFVNQNVDKEKLNRKKRKLERKYDIEFNIINVSQEMFSNLPINEHFSVEMYFRMIAQFILPENLDRILWIDIDIVCLENIKQFYYQDFDNKSMIVCADSMYGEQMLVEHKENLGIKPDTKYFNSGVLILNLDKMRKKYTMEEIMETSIKYKDKLKYPDQDILNILYEGDVKYTGKRYNYQLIFRDDIEKGDEGKIALLHYTSAEKPWRFKAINKASKYYWIYEKKRGHYLKWIAIYTTNYFYRLIKKIYFKIKGY